jgi:hypothetical protein
MFQTGSAHMTDISLDQMKFSCNGQQHIVAFDPPMKSLREARERVHTAVRQARSSLEFYAMLTVIHLSAVAFKLQAGLGIVRESFVHISDSLKLHSADQLDRICDNAAYPHLRNGPDDQEAGQA